MHTVDQLITSLPEFKSNIRRSRALTLAAVIALAPDSERTLVVTTACVSNERDYHLVHMLDCSPRAVMDDFPHEHEVLELRPYKWSHLRKVVQTFLAGGDIDALIAASR
jgi:hypothetical protein